MRGGGKDNSVKMLILTESKVQILLGITRYRLDRQVLCSKIAPLDGKIAPLNSKIAPLVIMSKGLFWSFSGAILQSRGATL